MMHRCLAPLHVVAFVVVAGLLTPAVPAGQSPAATASPKKAAATRPWTPPLTPDGQPDLQGVWLNNSATPLERPKALEGRQSLTDDEVAEFKRRAARLLADGNNDFAGADNLFLAVLANLGQYKNPNSTGTALEMIEREFDNRTSLIVDPADGRIPWAPEGRRRQDAAVAAGVAAPAAGPEDLTNAIRCITYGVPRLGLNNTGGAGPLGYYQIVQGPEYVALTLEAIHETRIIPLDGRPHLPESVRQWSGDSRGRWEGNTLVVDTTNFSPKSNVLGSTERLHVVERLARTAPDTIAYEITVSDSTAWTKPWTAVIRLKQGHHRIYEYACHEGNYYTMSGILSGARAVEKAARDAANGPK
jgi:hypothetical protein